MYHREESLCENPYVVCSGCEHGTVDGTSAFHIDNSRHDDTNEEVEDNHREFGNDDSDKTIHDDYDEIFERERASLAFRQKQIDDSRYDDTREEAEDKHREYGKGLLERARNKNNNLDLLERARNRNDDLDLLGRARNRNDHQGLLARNSKDNRGLRGGAQNRRDDQGLLGGALEKSKKKAVRSHNYRHGTVDGTSDFHTEIFNLPKLPTLSRPKLPKISLPKLSVPKMFSKSPAKAAAPAKASAPAKKAAPAKALPTKSAPSGVTDLNGKPLPAAANVQPTMIENPSWEATYFDQLAEKTTNPKSMFTVLQRKYKMSKDRKNAVQCNWLFDGQPVYTCMVLEADRLLRLYAKGDLNKMGTITWIPFDGTNVMTKEKITKAMQVPVGVPRAMWFVK